MKPLFHRRRRLARARTAGSVGALSRTALQGSCDQDPAGPEWRRADRRRRGADERAAREPRRRGTQRRLICFVAPTCRTSTAVLRRACTPMRALRCWTTGVSTPASRFRPSAFCGTRKKIPISRWRTRARTTTGNGTSRRPRVDRIIPIAHVPLYDADLALTELRRCLKLGFKGMFLAPERVCGKRPSHPDFDPLWAELQEANLPICIHLIVRFKRAGRARRFAVVRPG